MNRLARRVGSLEQGKGDYLTIGELLDRVGTPGDDHRQPDPRVLEWLDGLDAG